MNLSILDKLPLNGAKTAMSIALYALILGLTQMGVIEKSIGDIALQWVELLFGVGLAHKVDKSLRSE